MSLLDQLWDDTVAGPQPETGLGKLRKQSSFGFRSNNTAVKESSSGSVRSLAEKGTEDPVKVTRSIMIMKPSPLRIDQNQNGTPPLASPAGSTTPVTPLSGGGSFGFRRRSASETYEKASGIGYRSPRPPYDI